MELGEDGQLTGNSTGGVLRLDGFGIYSDRLLVAPPRVFEELVDRTCAKRISKEKDSLRNAGTHDV